MPGNPTPPANTEPERPLLAISEFRPSGILWAINRTIFHPRGYALALTRSDNDNPDNGDFDRFTILGDGSEVWAFDHEADDEGFAAFTDFLSNYLAQGGTSQETDAHE